MSDVNKNLEVMVRNYSRSPVALSTRDTHYLIPGGSPNAPAEFPMTLSELAYINSTSDVFKIGMLSFDPADEAMVYDVLRIMNWQDILRIDTIDDIILHPTTAKLERLIAIQNPMYFERVYGEYVGLRNAGHPISSSVEQVVKLRRDEFRKGIIRSAIKVGRVDDTAKRQAETDDKISELQDQIASLKALLAQQTAESSPAADAEKTPKAAQKRATRSKTTTAKGN